MIPAILAACALPMLLVGAHAAYSAWVARRHPPEGESFNAHGARQHGVTRGSGPLVVLLHGADGVHHDFPPALIDMLATDHTVLALDRPGHGHSARVPGMHGLAAHSAALRAVLRARTMGPAILVGHSYGAIVALRTALDEPALVRAVLAVTPVFATDARNQRWARIATWGPIATLTAWTCTLPVALAATPAIRSDAWYPVVPPSGLSASRAFPLRPAQLLVAVDDLRRLGPDLASLVADLSRLAVPLTVLAGELDRITPWETHALALHQRVAGSYLVRVADGGHWLMRQRPECVFEQVQRLTHMAHGVRATEQE
ncbi:MAG: alpha/beta fold hydrolase [Candidatus Eisenbacteria bacterium]